MKKMKSFNKKIGFLIAALFLVFVACEKEENLEITKPDPSFVLHTPSISSVFLNFGIPNNNALTITWLDQITGSSSYNVEMALDQEFNSIVNLGTVNTNSFSISVTDLNDAIASAGATSFRDIAVYFRINASNTFSNSVLFLITRYPVDPPVITNPVNGDSFVLSINNPNDVALTVDWTDGVLDSDLNIDVDYTVEAALSGTSFASPVVIGQTSNLASFSTTHSELNAVALGVGLAAGNAGNLDLRIVAKSTNENGSILERTSGITTISVTPYNVSFPNLYFVGSATSPGWNNNNNNTPVFRNQNVPNNYIYTGYFSAGAFKMLEVKGQWQPQWGTNDNSTLSVNTGSGSDPGTFDVATAGYYTYNFTTVGQSGSFTVTPYDATAAPTYTTMGLIGAAIGGWGDADEINFVQDANNPHLWYSLGVAFTSGNEFLIRANDGWSDVWRYTGSQYLYGTSNLAGSGDNFPFNAPSGNYDVWFNDLDGKYNIIPQ